LLTARPTPPVRLGVRMVRYSFPAGLFHSLSHAVFIPAHAAFIGRH